MDWKSRLLVHCFLFRGCRFRGRRLGDVHPVVSFSPTSGSSPSQGCSTPCQTWGGELIVAVLPSVLPPLSCGGVFVAAAKAAVASVKAALRLSLREAGLVIAASWWVCEVPQVALLSRMPCDGTPCTEAQVAECSLSLVLGKPWTRSPEIVPPSWCFPPSNWMMLHFAADNPSTFSCIMCRAGPTAWKPWSALLGGGGVLRGCVTRIHRDSVCRWNLWFPSAGVFSEVLVGRAKRMQITFLHSYH